uniref:Uncharacterized protein n=1 Tax=Lepeophtheirus salmonis TaxID=72036 RepID=A0A0K2UZT7_LEPSM
MSIQKFIIPRNIPKPSGCRGEVLDRRRSLQAWIHPMAASSDARAWKISTRIFPLLNSQLE